MARKSKVEALSRLERMKKAAQAFEGFKPASVVLTSVKAVPTRFCQVDHATRVGGWPIERFTLVHGPSNHGKTLFCAGLVDSFLALDHYGLFIDAERTSPDTWFRTLMGERFEHPGFFARRPESYEQTIAEVRTFLNTLISQKEEGVLPEDMSAIIVVDSMRKLVPKDMLKMILDAEKEVDENDVKAGRDRAGQLQAKMNAAWMDELVPMLEKAGAVMVAIAREMQNPDAKDWEKKAGQDYKLGGGGAMFYDASLVARVERAAYVKHGDGKDAKIYGERHRVTLRKTKVAGKDDKVAVGYFHSSNGVLVREGFDRARDVFDLGCRFEVIEKYGSNYSYEDERIAAGQHQAVVELTDNPDLLARVERDVRAKFSEREALDHDPETGEVFS